MHRRPSRTGIEVGLVLSVVGMLLGLAFNAGIQYERQNDLANRTTTLEAEYATIVNQQTPIQVRLDHIETILGIIQQQQQAELASKRVGVEAKP